MPPSPDGIVIVTTGASNPAILEPMVGRSRGSGCVISGIRILGFTSFNFSASAPVALRLTNATSNASRPIANAIWQPFR